VPYRDKAWKVTKAYIVESIVPDGASLVGSKAFVMGENDPISNTEMEAFTKVALPAVREVGGRPSGVNGGKIVARIGEVPKSITLVGFDSLQKAESYLESPTLAKPTPQREKAYKVMRSWIVEAVQ
jgi:uncharacterized protein (DUF1330 family)